MGLESYRFRGTYWIFFMDIKNWERFSRNGNFWVSRSCLKKRHSSNINLIEGGTIAQMQQIGPKIKRSLVFIPLLDPMFFIVN